MPSGRGGAREGAGRPAQWQNPIEGKDRKTINVPRAIADQAMQAAKLIDAGDPEILRLLAKKKLDSEQNSGHKNA
jgi:hypothetical protein